MGLSVSIMSARLDPLPLSHLHLLLCYPLDTLPCHGYYGCNPHNSLKWMHDQEGISTDEKFPHQPLLSPHLLHTHSQRHKEQTRALGKGMIYALLSSKQPQKVQ